MTFRSTKRSLESLTEKKKFGIEIVRLAIEISCVFFLLFFIYTKSFSKLYHLISDIFCKKNIGKELCEDGQNG